MGFTQLFARSSSLSMREIYRGGSKAMGGKANKQMQKTCVICFYNAISSSSYLFGALEKRVGIFIY